MTAAIALAVPKIEETIEVELSTGMVSGRVATRRQLGAGVWQLVVALPSGGHEVLTVVRAEDGGWCAAESASIGRAIGLAHLIRSGQPLHGAINVDFRTLADAVLTLAGISPC